MILKNNKLFKLPRLMGGSFSSLDRFDIPYHRLILKHVLQRSRNGNIEIICRAKDGPGEKRGVIRFSSEDRPQKDVLFFWFTKQIGNDIETIYNSDL